MFNYNGLTLVLVLVFSLTQGHSAEKSMSEDELRNICKLNMRISWATLGMAGIEQVAGLNDENKHDIFLTFRRAIDTIICNKLVDSDACKKKPTSNLDIDTQLTPSIELRDYCIQEDDATFCRTNFCDFFEYPESIDIEDKDVIIAFGEKIMEQASKLPQGSPGAVAAAEAAKSVDGTESSESTSSQVVDEDDGVEVHEYKNLSEDKDEL